MSRRWFVLFLPVWLVLAVVIAAVGFYFAFKTPAVTAMVVCWVLLGGGIWGIAAGKA